MAAADFLIGQFVSIDKRPGMGSQPNLASRSKVVSINKRPLLGGAPPNFGLKNIKFWPLFSRRPLSTPHISGTKRRIDKQKC